MDFRIRSARARDEEPLVQLWAALRSDLPAESQRAEIRALLAGAPARAPAALFVAESGRALVGFVHVGVRSHADGCDPSRPVGYVEACYVGEPHRRHGVARALLQAAEIWSRDQGCRELASAAPIDEEASQDAHRALGFEQVARRVSFKKRL